MKQFNLDGKSAIVTGGSKGLGQAMAAGLASAGANVLIVSRNLSEAQHAAAELSEDYGTKVVGCAADVTDPAQVFAMVDLALSAFGKIDILVNNAGINIRGPIENITLEQFQQVQRTNVEGPWLCTKEVVPVMKEAGTGRIINIASTLGLVGLANRTPYTASKGAIVQMTRAMALEFAPFGITCNAICPGPFLTEMNIPIADTEEAKTSIIGAVAMKRWGRLEEIQGSVIYLASEASSFVTGSILAVDGGWTAR